MFEYPDLPARMVCIGPGPGPKNVLAEFSDGTRLVVPYAVWKHRLSKHRRSMAEGTFVTILGSVEFDPQTRDAQGKQVTDVTIRGAHNQKRYRCTIWPNLKDFEVAKGDIVVFTGKGSTNTVDGDDGPKTYNNVSVYAAKNLGALDEGEKPANDNAGTVADDDIPF